MYFEFDDVRRIHQPYVDDFFRIPAWKPSFLNSPYLNWKRSLYAFGFAAAITEPVNHFANHVSILNRFYHWPNTRSEYNIFFKEVFRM